MLCDKTPNRDSPVALSHCSRSKQLHGVFEARCTSSSLQRVVEVQFPFRRHYAGGCDLSSCACLQRARGYTDWIRRGVAARPRNFGWLVFQRARHKPPRYRSWVVWRHMAHGADVCHDDCGGVRDRYAGSIFSHQTPFSAALRKLRVER